MISVLMSVYNEDVSYLRASIDSILSQTYKNFEFIIILDNPENVVLRKELEKYKELDTRIKLVFNEQNIGLAMSLNRGLEISKGEYIGRMDADDISVETRFEYQIEYLEQHPDVDILSTNKILIGEKGEVWGRGDKLPTQQKKIQQMLKYSNFIVHPSVMMKTISIKQIGGYRNLPTGQDLDLWYRAIDAGLKIGVLDEFLIKYRISLGGITQSRALKQVLTGKYIRQLRKERIKKGYDSFSADNLERFLLENGCYDQKKIEEFNKVQEKYREAQLAIRKNKRIMAVSLLLCAFFENKLMRRRLFRMGIAKLCLHF